MKGDCTWCGHPHHNADCPGRIETAAGPSHGKKVPIKVVDCPCLVNTPPQVAATTKRDLWQHPNPEVAKLRERYNSM